MSKKVMLFTFEKTFGFEGFKDDYAKDGIATIEQAIEHELYMHSEGFVTVDNFMHYEDDDYDSAFQIAEIGDVLEDGSVEVIQPDIGDLVQITTTYTSTWDNGKQSKTEMYKRVYRRMLNKNGYVEGDPWYDYYQDLSEPYVAGLLWSDILERIKPGEHGPSYSYEVEFLTPRPHHNMKIVYTAKDRRDMEANDAQHESA